MSVIEYYLRRLVCWWSGGHQWVSVDKVRYCSYCGLFEERINTWVATGRIRRTVIVQRDEESNT